MTKRDKLVVILVGVFLSIFLINYYIFGVDSNSGFADDPRDPSKKIYIDKEDGQYRYVDQSGVTEDTGEILHGIQIINKRE